MVAQPYLYSAVETAQNGNNLPYSEFNPKAVTEAHYAAFQERADRNKRKNATQDHRPLINFNQHPDSYVVVANPTVHHEPLPENTKKLIVWTRWVQLVFRVFQELGALGLLVCVICLKMKSDGPGWIIRVAPAWDVVISLYAIYHLLRPAKGRTPNSSGSYHFFALFMDTGMIPFYIFVALFANQNYNLQPESKDRWTSFFTNSYATTTIIQVTFFGSIVLGGLHLISIGLDLYLILMFRKIARLPPDMNPLEDNLTGSVRRKSQKHKHKNSEMTVSSVYTDMSEDKAGYYNESRLSMFKEAEARVIPWGHSRMNSDQTYSPHNPDSARLSRQQYDDFSIHKGPYSGRSSRVSIPGDGGHRSRAGTVVSPVDQPTAFDFRGMPPVSAYSDSPNQHRPATGYNRDYHTSAPNREMLKFQQKDGLLNDNWYVLADGEASDLGRLNNQHDSNHHREPTLPNVELLRTDSFQPGGVQPLKMNPPTPQGSEVELTASLHDDKENYDPIETGVARQLTVASNNTIGSSVYSESAPSLKSSMNARSTTGTPARKQYGDLASATREIRRHNNGSPFPTIDRSTPAPTTTTTTTTTATTPSRVISRSGTDIADMNVYGSENQSRRRDVSGKIAEEGRGGQWTNERYYAGRWKSLGQRNEEGRIHSGGTGYGGTGPDSTWHLVF